MPGNGTRRIYADHAATTPVRDEVLAAMLPHFTQAGFNPSSIHAEGRRAKAALDDARELAARALGATPRELVFTGGGSESINLAILGAARARRSERRHVVSAATEHHAVLHAVDVLREEGFEVTILPVDADGRLDAAECSAALRDDTALVTLMLANNELGTIHPVRELAALAHARGALFHTDAIQAVGRMPVDVRDLDVDLLSLAAHKFYGPKGVGLLYVREGTALVPLVVGGGQEAGLRAGTENVAGITGLARALELAVAERDCETTRLTSLREHFETTLLASVEDVHVNAQAAPRVAHISSIAFAGIDAPTLLVRLDLDGVAASAGSACAAGATEPSHVLRALGGPEWLGRGTIRFSFGRLTGRQEVNDLLAMLPRIIQSVRDSAPAVRVPQREVGR
jgi:cysteine desulfurase